MELHQFEGRGAIGVVIPKFHCCGVYKATCLTGNETNMQVEGVR